jgi:hypothetical protein
VEPSSSLSRRCQISESTAKDVGVSNGGTVKLVDPDTKKSIIVTADVSAEILDFSIKVASDVLNDMKFNGIELIVESAKGSVQSGPAVSNQQAQGGMPAQKYQPPVQAPVQPQYQPPQPQYQPPQPQYQPPQPQYQQQPQYQPPQPQYQQQPQSQNNSGFSSIPKPPTSLGLSQPPSGIGMGVPQPPSGMGMGVPQPPSGMGMGVPQPPSGMGMGMQQPPGMGMQAPPPLDPYPNKIDVNILVSQKRGSLALRVQKTTGCGGRVKMNNQIVSQLGLANGMLVGWEDPLTRSTGSARITVENISIGEIHMDLATADDTNIKADQIVVYSTEPPITHQDKITLEVRAQPNLQGLIMVNPRNAATLQVKEGDVLAFEDSLTGALGAAKFKIKEDLGNKDVVVDSELLEASGIGSLEVELKKNIRQVIPLQSIELGISPIKGENVWEIISMARQNIESIKGWLGNYVIFKGIKLRWEAANVACEILNTVPDLSGDILALINNNTTLTLKPIGLLTFNAILIIDISRSMMARDVEVKNIGPALEGIKAAMRDKSIQEFLSKFKQGIQVPRRHSAAFGAILFLSEKVGRGFGEKVSIVRFADEAQSLIFPNGKPYMDSSSGEKDILENAAKMIVEQIGNAYGQATNMGLALLKAQELLVAFQSDLPTMMVLLTDGVPTDTEQFYQAVQAMSQNPNLVFYIIGLGNPDDEVMSRAAALCGGEYFKPQDSGELLIWYSKRARDLQVKLKSHKT